MLQELGEVLDGCSYNATQPMDVKALRCLSEIVVKQISDKVAQSHRKEDRYSLMIVFTLENP